MTANCHSLGAVTAASVSDGMVRPKVAIVGPANSGKSVLFNALTGAYSIVANYPQTTVTPSRQNLLLSGEEVELIDTPGVAALNATSQDEETTMAVLLGEPIARILLCGDALALKRSLHLLVQLLELGIPTVFCLNKSDAAARRGKVIDANRLARTVGIPVVECAASRSVGLERLIHAMHALPAEGKSEPIRYPRPVEEAVAQLQALFPVERRPAKGMALLFLQGNAEAAKRFANELGEELLAKAKEIVKISSLRLPANQLRMALFQSRESWADQLAEACSRQATLSLPGFAYWAGWAARHPVLGWPIFISILWLTFQGVGGVANQLADLLDKWLFTPFNQTVGEMVTQPLLNEFLVGNFGILTMGVANAMVTVVPILLVFFLIVNFLEDTGYLPNLSVLTNRLLIPFGLTGKAILPIVLGTGCNTTATMSSRILETKRERLLVSFLIAMGVPCSVQLGVMMAILSTTPFSALLIVLTAVMGTSLLCGIAMNRLMPSDGRAAEFLLELPEVCWPHWRNIVLKTYYRLKWFLLEALPMFVMAAFLMFVLQKSGLLEGIKILLRPVITGFLSLPDKVTEVFILVLSRREVGAVYFKNMVEGGELDYTQIVTGLVVMTLFIPCISNTMVMAKEFGWRWAATTNLAIIAIAILVGGMTNYLLRLV